MADEAKNVRETRAVKQPAVDPEAKKAEETRQSAEARKATTKRKPFSWLWIIPGLTLLATVFWVGYIWPRGNTPAPAVVPTAVVQNAVPPATEVPVITSDGDYQGTDQCIDGKILANQFADLSRVPVGTLEGASVWEISWTGNGFGGYDRIVLIVPRMDSSHMAFVRNAKTIHGIQYCGFMKDIVAYSPTHIDALLQSSQDDQGNRPDQAEIGIFQLNLDGSVTEIRAAPKGLTVEAVNQRVIMTVH